MNLFLYNPKNRFFSVFRKIYYREREKEKEKNVSDLIICRMKYYFFYFFVVVNKLVVI